MHIPRAVTSCESCRTAVRYMKGIYKNRQRYIRVDNFQEKIFSLHIRKKRLPTQGSERHRSGLQTGVKDAASLEIVRAGETSLKVDATAKLI